MTYKVIAATRRVISNYLGILLVFALLSLEAHAQAVGNQAGLKQAARQNAVDSIIPSFDSAQDSAQAHEGNVWPTAGRSPRGRAGTDWFPKNSVSDLNSKPELQSASEIKYFLERRDHPASLENDSIMSVAEQVSSEQAGSGAAAAAKSLPPENTREGMVARFGDPAQDAPVLAKPDAPKPFQGLMAALEYGDTDLARKYARQYVRYVRNIQERSTRAMSMQGAAMSQEGMLDAVKEKSWNILPEERAFLEQERENAKLLKTEQQRMAALDDRALGVLKDAESLENLGADAFAGSRITEKRGSKEAAPSADEQELRANIRKIYQERITPDPKGRADVFFFMRTKDAKSAAQARELEQVYRKYIEDDQINIIALNLDTVPVETVRLFRRQTKASFPIKEGAGLAKALGVKDVPTVAVIAPTTGKAQFISEQLKFAEIDEIVGMTAGGGR